MTRSRYILIGDVHGCLAALQALIRRIAPRPDDTFVWHSPPGMDNAVFRRHRHTQVPASNEFDGEAIHNTHCRPEKS